jgi:GT2 family glycosyltransferase
MRIEIVVPCINLYLKYTKPAIDSVMEAMVRAKSHGVDCHITLIDNDSTDETKSEASKLNADLVYYHRNDERWGFQRSVNFGVAYGIEHGADAILVCNNDIVLHPEAIWRLVKRLSAGEAAMVTCLDVRGEMQQVGLLPSLISTLSANEKEQVEEAPHPNFSAFMINKEAWETIGEFDEVFFPAYFEDNDYHRRMNLIGAIAIVYPPAMFYHYGSKTQNEAAENGQPLVPGGMFENARANYVKKWGGVPGEEKFEHPYNDESNSIKITKQNESAN